MCEHSSGTSTDSGPRGWIESLAQTPSPTRSPEVDHSLLQESHDSVVLATDACVPSPEVQTLQQKMEDQLSPKLRQEIRQNLERHMPPDPKLPDVPW